MYLRTSIDFCWIQTKELRFKRTTSATVWPWGLARRLGNHGFSAFLLAETWHLSLEGERVAHGFRSLWGGDESLDVSGCGYVAILEAMQKQRLQRDVVTFGNAMCVWDLNWFWRSKFLVKTDLRCKEWHSMIIIVSWEMIFKHWKAAGTWYLYTI